MVKKKPVSNGVAKVPVVMQMEALECGAACLDMILAYYGKWVALEQVRLDCGVSRDGSNARNIIRAARKYGLTANGYKLELSSLREKGIFPCVIHWEYNHFVVLDGFKGSKAYVNDPARGSVAMSIDEFEKGFTGIALFFEATEEFVADGKRKSIFEFAAKRLKDARGALIFTLVMSIFAYAFTVVNPFLAEYFMDQILSSGDDIKAASFLFIMGLLAVLQIIVSWIQAVYSLKIDGKLAINGSTSFMWKVLKLPMEFFSQRMSGDIMMRQSTNEEIAQTMVNIFAPLCMNACMMFFYLVVLIRYSVPLTILGVTTVAINLFISKIIADHRINVTRGMMIDMGKLSTTTLSGISMIETIKASGAENGFFEGWLELKAKVDEKEVQFMRGSIYWEAVPVILTQLANHCIMFAGVFLAMNGKFTIGMITAFQLQP